MFLFCFIATFQHEKGILKFLSTACQALLYAWEVEPTCLVAI